MNRTHDVPMSRAIAHAFGSTVKGMAPTRCTVNSNIRNSRLVLRHCSATLHVHRRPRLAVRPRMRLYCAPPPTALLSLKREGECISVRDAREDEYRWVGAIVIEWGRNAR